MATDTDRRARRRARRPDHRAEPVRPLRLSRRRRRGDDHLRLRLSGGIDAAAEARRGLLQLEDDVDASLLETLRLLVTELVSNAVKHAAAKTVTLKVAVEDSTVVAEVTDEGMGFDPDETGTPRANHSGWGLFMVEELAQRWGVVRDGKATKVWFELSRG